MISPNNIYLGNCYELIKEIPDKSIDCIYTDIPYLFQKGGSGTSRIAMKVKKEWSELSQAEIVDGIDLNIFNEFVRVIKNINIFIWCSKEQIYEILDWFKKNTNSTYQVLVWCKTNPVPMCNGNWLSDIEYCLYFNRGTKLNDGYNHKSKWYVSGLNVEDKNKYLHPTIKPLELVKRHLLHTTQEGGVILDTFMGSGTTCKACQEIKRQYIGFEINDKYFNIAKDRLNNINAKGEVSLF